MNQQRITMLKKCEYVRLFDKPTKELYDVTFNLSVGNVIVNILTANEAEYLEESLYIEFCKACNSYFLINLFDAKDVARIITEMREK